MASAEVQDDKDPISNKNSLQSSWLYIYNFMD